MSSTSSYTNNVQNDSISSLRNVSYQDIIISDDTNFTLQECQDLIMKSLEFWTPTNDITNFLSDSFKKFGYNESSMNNVDIRDLEKRHACEVEKISLIKLQCQDHGILSDQNEQYIRNRKLLDRIIECISCAHSTIESFQRTKNAYDPSVEHYLPLDSQLYRYSSCYDEELNDEQQLKLYVLERLYKYRYRRYDNSCWKQIVTPDGYNTKSWDRVCSIKDFVLEVTRKEVYGAQWRNLNKKRGTLNSIVEFLEECKDPEFPELKPDRHVWSFLNGIWDGTSLKWHPYSSPETRMLNICSCKYFPIALKAELLEEFSKTRDWYSILKKTQLHKIIEYQKFGNENQREEIEKWFYILMGRLLYNVLEWDNWQVAPFLKGVAGCGKSTIGKILQKIYQEVDVATMDSNAQEVFGLEGLLGKFLWICMEVKKNFKIPQSSIQSMLSGDPMSVNRKGKKPEHLKHWISQGMFLGNELPPWIDSQGSMSRRTILFEMLKRVTGSDPKLEEKISQEIPTIIVFLCLAYRRTAHSFGHFDFWEIPNLPSYFADTRKNLQIQINPFLAFIKDEDYCEQDTKRYTCFKDLQQCFNEWCELKGYKRENITKDLYAPVFNDCQMTMSKEIKEWGSKLLNTSFVSGLGLKGKKGKDINENNQTNNTEDFRETDTSIDQLDFMKLSMRQ